MRRTCVSSSSLNHLIFSFAHSVLHATVNPLFVNCNLKLLLQPSFTDMAYVPSEYGIVSWGMIVGEEPLVMPAATAWRLLSPSNSYKMIVNPESPLFLSLPDDAAHGPVCLKFDWRSSNNDGSLYVSHRGYGAVVRKVPFSGCKLEVTVVDGILDNVVDVVCHTMTGEMLFHRNFQPGERVTAGLLNRYVEYSLVDESRASQNSVFFLHWDRDLPVISSNTLLWRPTRRRRLDAAGQGARSE